MRPHNQEQNNTLVKLSKKIFSINLSSRTSSYVLCILFFIMSATSMAIGGYMAHVQDDQQIIKIKYEVDGNCTGVPVKICQYKFHVDKEIMGPIQGFYQLDDFVGSTRDFIESKSIKQLKGVEISQKESRVCGAYRTNRQMNKTNSWKGTPLDPDAIASPCGFQAYLYFQDQFSLDNRSFTNNYNGDNFKRIEESQEKQWVDPTNPSFQVWMSQSLSANMVKFYGNYSNNLQKKQYTLRAEIKTNYSLETVKYFILMAKRSGMQDSVIVGWISFGLGAFSILICIFIGARILQLEIQMQSQRIVFPQNSTTSTINLKSQK